MNSKGSALVIIVSIVAVIAIAFGAYMYGQNQSLKGKVVNQTSSPVASQNPNTLDDLTSTPASTSVPKGATVIYEAEGSFTASEKSEIKKKIIDPFVDYYAMEDTGQVLLTLTISKNNQASKDQYPYQAQAIFQGGGNMGFLIMKSGTGVDWWFPECLMGCNLSSAYKLKYPEVAAKVQ